MMPALRVEEEAISQGMQVDSRICQSKGNRFSPGAPERRPSVNTLMLDPHEPFRTSDLQNYKIIHLYCLSHCIYGNYTAAIGN